MKRLRELKIEAELLPKVKGRQSVITGIDNRIHFCISHFVSEREIELFIKESREEIDGILSAAKAKD